MHILSRNGAEIARANGLSAPANSAFIKLMAALVGGLLVLASAALFLGILI